MARAYLAAAFPAAELGPRADELAHYHRWMFFAAGPLESAVLMNSMEWQPSDEQQRTAGWGSYERALDTLCGWLGVAFNVPAPV